MSVQKALEGIDSEIIVVDNDSKDDSCEIVKTLFPEVILIENKETQALRKGITSELPKPKENIYAF